jgi:hypothetical protein
MAAIVAFHAHPDDEALATGDTLAQRPKGTPGRHRGGLPRLDGRAASRARARDWTNCGRARRY